MGKRVTRIYTGPDGESHFEDIEIALEEEGAVGQWSKLNNATGIIFGELASDCKWDWHNAPRRQFVITLDGEGEIEIGDGTRRRFKAGDVLLAEDTTGRGHITRVLNNIPRTVMFVTLD